MYHGTSTSSRYDYIRQPKGRTVWVRDGEGDGGFLPDHRQSTTEQPTKRKYYSSLFPFRSQQKTKAKAWIADLFGGHYAEKPSVAWTASNRRHKSSHAGLATRATTIGDPEIVL
jgi:hypothetical protein